MNSRMEETGRARLIGLFRFTEKGKPGEPVEEAHFVKGLGMEGDRHADGGSRQLTLLSGEIREWMDSQEVPGLCFRRYKANLVTEGLAPETLKPGRKIKIGTAVLAVAESSKECFPECVLHQSGTRCRLSSGGVYFTVEESGIAKVGSTILFL